MSIDPLWSSEDISTIVSKIIQNIRLISNGITEITPFEAHFGRKPNTALSNIVTKPNKQNLSYKRSKILLQIENYSNNQSYHRRPSGTWIWTQNRS